VLEREELTTLEHPSPCKLCRCCYDSKVHSLQQTLKPIGNCVIMSLLIPTAKPTRRTISQIYFILEQHPTFLKLNKNQQDAPLF
jgi:hypothetical protein